MWSYFYLFIFNSAYKKSQNQLITHIWGKSQEDEMYET